MYEAVYLLTAAGFVLVAIVMVGRGVRRPPPSRREQRISLAESLWDAKGVRNWREN